jgi:hypothetical protein
MFTPKFRPALIILRCILVVDAICLAAYFLMQYFLGPIPWPR